jgi:hypothetical protein
MMVALINQSCYRSDGRIDQQCLSSINGVVSLGYNSVTLERNADNLVASRQRGRVTIAPLTEPHTTRTGRKPDRQTGEARDDRLVRAVQRQTRGWRGAGDRRVET